MLDLFDPMNVDLNTQLTWLETNLCNLWICFSRSEFVKQHQNTDDDKRNRRYSFDPFERDIVSKRSTDDHS